jgi:polyhydroxyalkanoate synthesis regulator phasin
MGGLAGAGEAEGSLEERLPGAIEGAEMGAVVGGAIPVAGAAIEGIKSGVSKVAQVPFVQKSLESFKRGIKGENLVTEGGRRQAADIVRNQSGEFFDDIKKLQSEVGEQIQGKIDDATEAGEQIDLTDDVKVVLDKLKVIKAEGSKEAASYASSVEGEIKKILGIKPDQVDDLSKLDLPEGLSPSALKPKVAELGEEAEQILVDPKKAQDIKQVLANYVPRKGMTPQEVEPAGIAKEFRNIAGDKLDEVTGVNEAVSETIPSLNQQYGLIKDSLKRLTINEKKLPEQIKEKINNIVSKLENEDISGDNARALIDDVYNNIKQVSPDVAQKYETSFKDIVGRLKLSQEIGKGLQNFGWGTFQAIGKSGANIAGLAAGKTGLATAGKVVGQGVKTLTDAAVNSPIGAKAIVSSEVQGASGAQQIRKAVEPHTLQRQVAQYAEKADPEVLKEQAESIRSTYGKDGEQLATILNNMAGKDANARRALMFTILQNPNHRKMLGLTKEEVK